MRLRHLPLAAVVFLLLALAGGCAQLGLSPQAEKVKLSVFIWSSPGHNTIPKEVVEKYNQKYPNVEIEFIESTNAVVYPRMQAAWEATRDKPLVNLGYFNPDVHDKGVMAGMWDKMDPANMPNAKDIPSQYHLQDEAGIIYAMGPWGLSYNPKKVKTPPTSYADLWANPEYKGRVIMLEYNWPPLVMAARMNGGGERNIDPGFKIWAENAKQLYGFYTSNDQNKNAFISGDAWLSLHDLGIATSWKEEGVPIEVAVPKEGVIAWPLFLHTVKGNTPAQKKAAEQLINELIAPEVLARYAELTNYVPTNTKTTIPAKLKGLPQFQPGVMEKAIVLDWTWMAQQHLEWKARWDREVRSKM